VGEPFVSILAALAGVMFGSASNWFSNARTRDDAATVALIELSASVKHIDKTLQRFESAFDGVYSTLQRHDNRITRLEATHGPLD
jgi:enoyl reductase-like protein